MLSERLKLIYLHAPKTGGNSIQSILLEHSDDQKVLIGHQDGTDRFEVRGQATKSKHAMLSDYAEALGAGLAGYRVAISVRHPFDRAVSLYFSPHRWLRQHGQDWQPTTPTWDRDAFLRFVATMPSQASFLTLDGKVRPPDFAIRYETLATDFAALLRALGLPPRDLPHVNQSAASGPLLAAARADDALRQLVCHQFADDLALFGYDTGTGPG